MRFPSSRAESKWTGAPVSMRSGSGGLQLTDEMQDPLAVGLVEHFEADASLAEAGLRGRILILAPGDATARLDAPATIRQLEGDGDALPHLEARAGVQADSARREVRCVLARRLATAARDLDGDRNREVAARLEQ